MLSKTHFLKIMMVVKKPHNRIDNYEKINPSSNIQVGFAQIGHGPGLGVFSFNAITILCFCSSVSIIIQYITYKTT